ncbi:MAG: peptidoglycan bridge formation glycyltransferase FemA/FemB family protein, partial [Anaerolineae bacterium]|nr:peptidoglycan bridge formation glycyltransferase FemA/FemB family protein [Anaerolineae bacterium]
MAEASLAEWNRFLAGRSDAHILQTGEWGELKSAFGWDAARMVSGDSGIQILFRRLPLGFTIAYAPKPVFGDQSSVSRDRFWTEVDLVCRKRRAVFLKIEPDLWENQKLE